MKILNKLKSDRQDLISNLLDNIESLEKLAFEQQAEIEMLKENNQKLYEEMAERQKEEVAIAKRMGKSEAIKEFAERLKAVSHPYADTQIVFELQIDNLVEEMAGDDNA